MKRTATIIATILLIVASQSSAQNDILAEINDIPLETVRSAGFTIEGDQQVFIEAVGAGETGRELAANAWILNAQTREVVWEMFDAESSYRSRRLQEVNETVSLPAGNYEVYYAFFPYYNFWHSERRNSFGDVMQHVWNEIFDNNDDYRYYRNLQKDLKIVVRGKGRNLGAESVQHFQDDYKENAVVSMAPIWDDRYERQGFTLDRPMEIQIYALGETGWDDNWDWGSRRRYRDDDKEVYDFGWIINTQTREKVWKMTYADSKHAGGAPKNRMIDQVISLPAGSYAAFFVTDDSHSERRWNAPPPYDPMFWGLTIRVKDPAMRAYVKKFDYEPAPDKNVIVGFTKLGDDEFRSAGFTLNRPMNLRIYALGEGRDNDMFDYGWIVDAKTHRKVWEMDYGKTEHAGGASKNRLFDGTARLDKGSYIAYFRTDDSHSYFRWNSSRPYDAEHWGLTIMAADENFNPADVGAYKEEEDQSILAQLTRVRDHDRERKPFTLKRDTEVRIYAIGEGRNGDMFDYGWIEDANSGKVVWEMTYRMTEHAGGASKNRLYDDVVSLKAGDYVLHYETDGSHSFNDWNDDPPHDPVNYGITLYLTKPE
jgi:hypothetical protein